MFKVWTSAVAVLMLLNGCSPPAAPPTPQERIAAELRTLLRAPEGGFVIIEVVGAKKFVQFIGAASEPLLIDLPFQALTPEE